MAKARPKSDAEPVAEPPTEPVTAKAEQVSDTERERLARESRKMLFERHLSQPFHPNEIKWKAQSVKANRCLAVAYIDARLVMDRLDDAAGVDGWRTQYEVLQCGSVVCRLSVLTPYGMWVEKSDVGSPSEQPDAGDRLKAAFSDALKRAAVHFGIGRYLYRLGHQWVDYDPVKKRPAVQPSLPAFAIPKKDVPDPRPYFDPNDADDGPAPAATAPAAAASPPPPPEKPNKDNRPVDPVDPKKKAEDAEKAGEDAKKAQALLTKRLDWWTNSLDGCETPAQMTELIADNLSVEPVQIKAQIWHTIQQYIISAKLKWDPKSKEVIDPNGEPGDAIPF